MRYRKLDANGDYVFGQGAADFHVDLAAVAQAIQTNLLLFKGSFWRDQEAGIPMFQLILGAPGSEERIPAIDQMIQRVIEQTQGVTEVVSYTSHYDREERDYRYRGIAQSIYSQPINFSGSL